MQAMKVLVTGSRGFIGRHLVPALAAAGHHVVRGISSERTTPEDAAERIVVDFSRDVEVNANRWFELAGTPPDKQQVILEKLRSELAGGEATGMSPFWRDQEVMFIHRWLIAVGVTPSSAAAFLKLRWRAAASKARNSTIGGSFFMW